MPIKVTYQNPGLEYDENMVCEDFLGASTRKSSPWQGLFFSLMAVVDLSLPRPLNSSKFQLKDKPLELLINGPFSQHFLKL